MENQDFPHGKFVLPPKFEVDIYVPIEPIHLGEGISQADVLAHSFDAARVR